MQAEANALEKLAEVSSKLATYQRICGDLSSLSPGTAQLTEQLRQKEEELHRLRLLDTQRSQVRSYNCGDGSRGQLTLTQTEMSMFTELERLSTAWESLDAQMKQKVYDIMEVEERLKKSGLDVWHSCLVVDGTDY